MLLSTRHTLPSSGALRASFFAFVHRERRPLTDAPGYPAATRTMPGNSAPAAYQQQGEVLNAFARDQNASNADFAALLDEDYLRALKPVKKDAKLPANAEPKNFRYHARRHRPAAVPERGRRRAVRALALRDAHRVRSAGRGRGGRRGPGAAGDAVEGKLL